MNEPAERASDAPALHRELPMMLPCDPRDQWYVIECDTCERAAVHRHVDQAAGGVHPDAVERDGKVRGAGAA
ncbi:hypothetical protein WQE_02497 [Paraburkholderia hospita]|uniref:Transcriptional regulator n=1 Tax=Paraburkholderia hospita TaxID=169430 RepID=A0ABN0FV59_9BURK|nr:hypothetical protein WQE_02497 [Paraburkholderia hospita]